MSAAESVNTTLRSRSGERRTAASVGVNCSGHRSPPRMHARATTRTARPSGSCSAASSSLNWLAIQADYDWYDKGESQIPINSSRNYTVSGDAWEVSVKPSLPLGEHFELYARVGWNWYNVDGKYQFIQGSSDSDDAAMAAGGVAFKFTPEFSVQAEYEYVDVDSGALDAATIRAVYHFKR